MIKNMSMAILTALFIVLLATMIAGLLVLAYENAIAVLILFLYFGGIFVLVALLNAIKSLNNDIKKGGNK